jgi:outer membrane protein assembly factor BamB
MKLIITLFFFFLSNTLPLISNIIYLDPVKDAKYVKINNTIIIAFDKLLSPEKVIKNKIVSITGSKSGRHNGKITIAGDGKTLLFIPEVPFEYSETVTVVFHPSRVFYDGSVSERLEYFFTTESFRAPGTNIASAKDFYIYELFNRDNIYDNYTEELPILNITVNNSPSAGKIFISNFPFTGIPNVPHLIIAENNGSIYTGMKLKANALDFKKLDNGNLGYFDGGPLKYYSLDTEYRLIDSFYCGNGYLTDGHELKILNNEHALLMSYDSQTVDMSQIVTGGSPNCLVTGLVIQEIDSDKNVVFQWRSWDHIPITDAQHQNMTTNYLDYIHGNAIDFDNDGNILISSRHLDEITKINRQTGSIIWRLGGKGNNFTFINDPGKFNYQHGVRRLANGNIILFDNGNFHTPPHSRAVEYALDETNMTATMVWQYRNTPDNFGFAMGFAQRLGNGNTVISWGSTNPTLTEVTPSGQIALELSLPQGVYSYRGFKFDWSGLSGYIDLTLPKPPVSYKLSQNYPNPFNPVTKIDFDIPENSFVTVKIYDVLGRLVSQPVNSDMRAGAYSIDINASQFTSGVYFYTLRTGSFFETKKMVILK